MENDEFGVPAGWYPDPLGLPQLRWWDSQAWTEHTSEARAPIVIQPATQSTPTVQAAADEEFPSRREQRERERAQSQGAADEPAYDAAVDLDTAADVLDDELSAQPLLAATLRELEPPIESSLDGAAPGPRSAASHANTTPAASAFSALAEELDGVAPEREIKQRGTYTFAVWMIALLPLLQTAASIGLLLGGLGHNFPLIVIVVVLPYLLVIGFAAYDRLELRIRGFAKPASALWALLTHPAYLIARAFATFKETGKGFAPLVVFGSSLIGVLVAVIAMPGILISVSPASFAQEVENTVIGDAAALGAQLTVECPNAPVVVGETVTCIGEKPSGEQDSILVGLERQAGWITWQVKDWGTWVITD